MNEMTEFEKKLLGKLEMLNEWISRLVAYLEAKQPDLEMINKPRITNERIEVQESILMDLENVTIMAKTPKAILSVKKGYQKWIPLSTLDEMQKEVGYELGSQYDLILTEKGKWIDKKSWEPFKPKKEGK